MLLLIVVWLVALVPLALRKLAERHVSSSVAQFHQSIRAIDRACPVVPGTDRVAGGRGALAPDPAEVARRQRRERELTRARTARRRRTLVSLAGATGGAFVLGAIPALRPLWYLALVTFLLTAAYVALLVWLQRMAAEAAADSERAIKVVPIGRHFGERHPESGPAVGLHRPLRPAFVLVDAR